MDFYLEQVLVCQKDWLDSCRRKDNFSKRLMYVRRLDAAISGLSRRTSELADFCLARAQKETEKKGEK